MRTLFLLLALLSVSSKLWAGLIWPTANPAFQNGQSIEAYIQPTASGVLESGLFGCVRNGGARFHEGMDLYPLSRDPRGEALDKIYAVLPGRVVYVNASAGHNPHLGQLLRHHIPNGHFLF